MSMIDRLKEFFSKDENGKAKVKVKKVKLTRRDIQENLVKVNDLMEKVQIEICKIREEMSEVDMSTASGKEKYNELRAALDDKNEIYSSFQCQQKTNIELLNQLNKSGRGETIAKVVSGVGGTILSGVALFVGLGLNRENPSILKIIDWIVKPFRAPLKF